MSNIAIFGAQWGDEGKGKIVDYLTENADIVVRFAGGANAGHTLVVDGMKIVIHLLPSGVVRPNILNLMTDGMVIDPESLKQEIVDAKKSGIIITPLNLKISFRAHIVMPYHRLIDGLRETRSENAVGSTKRGIGPAYGAKAERYGIRMGDLIDIKSLVVKLRKALEEVNPKLKRFGEKPVSAEDMFDFLMQARANLLPYLANTAGIITGTYGINPPNIVFEGAQGIALDIDQGTYPNVTSSCTAPAGVALGAGIDPVIIDTRIGICKAYVTRVGNGPFPTELNDKIGEHLAKVGGEFGATTGRARKCGWLDAVAVRSAVMLGLDEIALTKLDILRGLDVIKICVAYELDGKPIESWGDLPDMDLLYKVKPVYKKLPGFYEDISKVERKVDLPKNARNFIDIIEAEVCAPITYISVGPDRNETIKV